MLYKINRDKTTRTIKEKKNNIKENIKIQSKIIILKYVLSIDLKTGKVLTLKLGDSEPGGLNGQGMVTLSYQPDLRN